MTIRPRAVRSLKEARTRLRDIAAARHSAACDARSAAARRLDDEQDTLDDFLDEAPTLLARASSVEDLARLAEATGEFELAIVDAEQACATATRASEATADALRARARQLRSIEKLEERLETERALDERRIEQRRTDEIVASRR